jgi:hypothetical protein
MGIYTLGAITREQRFFGGGQLNLERGNDFLRALVLHGEGVGEIGRRLVRVSSV